RTFIGSSTGFYHLLNLPTPLKPSPTKASRFPAPRHPEHERAEF
ncbi:hypothetical protein OKW49_006141, partial [Paraburkholderia youngii]